MSAATIKPEVIRKQKINLTVYQVGSFPDGVDGISAPDDKGGFMILINADQSPEEQARTFLHEMLHIWRGDHDRVAAEGVQKIESEAHAFMDSLNLETIMEN